MEGQVWYQIRGLHNMCEIYTTRRYDDGTWHNLTTLYSGGECSVTVDEEMVTYSTSELIIPTQEVGNNYIGGVPILDGR